MANTGRRSTSAEDTEPEVKAEKAVETPKNTSSTSTRKKSTTTTKTTSAKAASTEEVAEAEEKPVKRAPQKKIIPKNVDPNQYVTVRNGFQGRLIYKSSHTGEMFEWDEYGAEQEMELRELKNAKSSHKKFFENNWFMFDEDWIVDYLGVSQYYKHAISIDHFDEIFEQTPEELEQTISQLSNGQKKSVAYRAEELIAENKIDSLSVINTLERALNIELIEK